MLYNSAMDRNAGNLTAFSRDAIALGFLLAMVLWFNEEIVVGGKVPFFRDLGPYFYPMRWHLAESFRSGELPLWNRHVSMGFPFLANLQAGAFYLPHLSFLVLPFFDAVRFLFVFHYFVAALGGYCLCRQWGYPSSLSLIGSILFAFGGMLVSLGNLLDHFQAAVWLPWVILFGERSLRSNAWRDFCLLTAALLVQFLAGSPEIYGMTLGLLLLDGLRLKAEDARRTYRALFSHLLGANALVAGLAMVQILPTVELFLQSWRSEIIPYANVTAWSLHPIRLINLFFLDKEVNLHVFNGFHFYFGHERPLIISLYLGAMVLPGICLWFFASSRKEKATLLGLVFVSLVLAIGDYTPLYPFLFRLFPFLGLVRFPEKFFFVASAVLLFIALSGFFRFLRDDRLPMRRSQLAASLLPSFIFLLPYLFFRFHVDALIRFVALARQSSPSDISTLMISSAVLVHLERQLSLMIGVFLLSYLWKSGRIRDGLFGSLMVAVVFFDLSSAHRAYQFALDPKAVYREPKIMDVPDKAPYRLFYVHNLSYLHPNYYRFSTRPYAETVSSVFANLIPNTGVFFGFDYMQELDALGRKPYNLFLKAANNLPPERLYRLLGVLNVKYLNSLQPLPAGEITLLRHFPEYPSWLYRMDRVSPRTYVASGVVVEKDPLKSIDRLSSMEFNALKEVILERPLSLPQVDRFVARAKVVRYVDREAAITASLNSPGVLVLADSFYPGWEVYVNGEKKEILRANFFFRGVLLPPGNHLVEFKYQPYWFKLGLVLSSVTGSLLLFLTILLFFNRHRSSYCRSGDQTEKAPSIQ